MGLKLSCIKFSESLMYHFSNYYFFKSSKIKTYKTKKVYFILMAKHDSIILKLRFLISKILEMPRNEKKSALYI